MVGSSLTSSAVDGFKPINKTLGDSEITFRDLAEKILKISNYDPKITFDKSKPEGQSRRVLRNDKAKKVLGFKALTSLDDGLKSTINWVRDNIEI